MSGLNRRFKTNTITGYLLTNKILLKILKKLYLSQKKRFNNDNNPFTLSLKEIIDNKTINAQNIVLLMAALEKSITNYDFLLDINKKTMTPIATDEYKKNNSGSRLIMKEVTIHNLEMNTLYQYISKYFSIESIDYGYVCTNMKTGIKTLCLNESQMEVA